MFISLFGFTCPFVFSFSMYNFYFSNFDCSFEEPIGKALAF